MAYCVYIIRLDDAVKYFPRFIRENPGMNRSLPAFYVGQTANEPLVRFEQHKDGYKACSLVRNYGLEIVNPVGLSLGDLAGIPTRQKAEILELVVSSFLRACGYGVWSN